MQITAKGDLGYDLGTQGTANFNYTDESGLAVSYTSSVDKRYVTLMHTVEALNYDA